MLNSDGAGVRELPTILLVEDHVDTRQMYAELLGGSYEVMQAGDGNTALELMHSRLPVVVITDLSLPGVDGLELVRRIRLDPRTHSVPVVVLSGYSGAALEERARDAGCDRLLQKPCMPDVLIQLIDEMVTQHRSRT